MTLPSSCAPLTGISRARLPAWALPDGWPTRANGEPLLADLAFRDGRIAALTPTDQPTPGLWDLAGALTLPGLVEPHAHLDKTFTIERCRPTQAGLLAAIHAMHEDRRHWTRADIQRRASAALARAAANGVTHLRSHVDWFTADAPDAWQEIARLDTGGITGAGGAGPAAPVSGSGGSRGHCPRGRQQRRALPAGRLHPLLQLGRRRHGKSAVQRGPLGSGSGFAY